MASVFVMTVSDTLPFNKQFVQLVQLSIAKHTAVVHQKTIFCFVNGSLAAFPRGMQFYLLVLSYCRSCSHWYIYLRFIFLHNDMVLNNDNEVVSVHVLQY